MALNNLDKQDLGVKIGERLKNSRLASEYLIKDAALKSGVGATQISSFEQGKLPPVAAVIALAKLYAVSVDYICCVSDDPIAEHSDLETGILAHCVGDSLSIAIQSIKHQLTQYVLRAIIGKRRDRVEIHEICEMAICVKEYQERVKQLNPDYEDDIRGAANLDNAINNLSKACQNTIKRIELEKLDKTSLDPISEQHPLQQTIFSSAENKFKNLLEKS